MNKCSARSRHILLSGDVAQNASVRDILLLQNHQASGHHEEISRPHYCSRFARAEPQGVQANNIHLHFFVLITMTIIFKGHFLTQVSDNVMVPPQIMLPVLRTE